MLAGGDAHVALVAMHEPAVDGDVVDAFDGDVDVFRRGQVDLPDEVHLRLVVVQAPERGPGDVALDALRLHPVGEPDLEIARGPDPGRRALRSREAADERQQETDEE